MVLPVKDKIQKKKESILQAAAEVFANCGFYNAKIAKIAEIAGVGAGSIYLYYKNKQDLLDEILNEFWKKMCSSLEQLAGETALTPDEQRTRMINILFDTLVEDSYIGAIFVHENSLSLWSEKVETNPYFARFFETAKTVLEKGQASAHFSPELDAGLTFRFVAGGIRELLHQWFTSKEEIPLETIKKNIQILSRQGLLHPEKLISS